MINASPKSVVDGFFPPWIVLFDEQFAKPGNEAWLSARGIKNGFNDVWFDNLSTFGLVLAEKLDHFGLGEFRDLEGSLYVEW